MKIDLTGKTALVTGASRGIGAAIALRLAEAGAHVLVAARSAAAVGEVAKNIVDNGGLATAVELDITAADVRERVKALIEAQPIDILVNNAGITADDLFIRMKPEAWTSVLRTNLDSAFHITQEVVKKMIRARWGRVINISSVVGLMGNVGQANYAASKAALIGFTKALALELHHDGDDGRHDGGSAEVARGPHRPPTPRRGRRRRVRRGVPRLRAAGYITGTVLNVSGGLYT